MSESQNDSMSKFLRDTPEARESTIAFARKILDDGKKEAVSISLDRKPVTPERLESPPRRHICHDADTFAGYISANKTDNTVVLADVAERSIEAVLDDKAAQGFEVIRLQAQLHPLFVPWNEFLCSAAAEKRTLTDIVDFLLANRRSVIEPEGKALALILSQVKVSKHMEMQTGKGAKCLNGLMISTEITGQDNAEFVQVPEILTVQVPLFVGRRPVKFDVDLLLSAPKEDVLVQVSSPDLVEVMHKEFMEMLESLKFILSETCVVGLGRVCYGDWRYVR